MPRSIPQPNERMTFGEHLEALRWHVIRALIAVAICLVVCLIAGERILDFVLAPIRRSLDAHQAGMLVVRSVWEALVSYVQISVVVGMVLACPWVFYQLWGFVAPGLYPHEKRVVYLNLPFLIGLFLAGVAFGWFLALPLALEFMIPFTQHLGFQMQITVSSWVAFALVFPLAFGITFELPLVMVLLSKIGLATAAGFRRHRRVAIMISAVVSAVFTPTIDPLGMMLMFVPLVVLYEAGIWVVRCIERRPAHRRDDERGESGDLWTILLAPVLAGHAVSRRCMNRPGNLT